MANELLQRQLKTQLYAKYSGDTTGFKTAVTGGMYYVKAPATVTQENYPIVLYYFLPSSGDYYLGQGFSPSVETVPVIFKILSASTTSTEAENILKLLETVYDGCSLTLSGWTLRQFHRELRNSITGPYVDEFGIWHLNALYRAVCDKS
ncbi:MAG: hypothetical protein WC565_09320 [Parcubacteria group bacterium]